MLSDDSTFNPPLHVGRPNVGDREAFLRLAAEMFDRRWLSNDGPLVQEFESRLAGLLGAKHVIAVTNGTLGLELVIDGLGLTGEVIVPAFTFVATAHALEVRGLRPVFADIDPETHNLDVASVRSLITPETSAILAVHLWGRPAALTELQQLADDTGVKLIYDAAHAFGVTTSGRRIGTFGAAEVFSFHATKFFNTFEGGAVSTNDDELAARLRLSRNFGFAGEDRVVSLGTNAKMTEICAAMGLVNLDDLDTFVDINRKNLERYRQELAGTASIRLHDVAPTGTKGNYQYVVAMVEDGRRDEVLAALRKHNVLARRYFWPGVHRMEPYATRWPKAGEALPQTEAIADRVLVLPTGSSVNAEAITRVAAIITDVLGRRD
ncbi:DegT/DnrJ/EryC1/StrS family aminotransferase [Microbacterium paludicola]|uniref:DegT/DnrJ/EryC1/StrS family aminotransferase n=1 Tax=Microbacterium paludicola TaxID=300019 RepID=UPI003879C1D7